MAAADMQMRLHLRVAPELQPGAALEDLRELFVVTDEATIADLERGVKAQLGLHQDLLFRVRMSKLRGFQDIKKALRDDEFVEVWPGAFARQGVRPAKARAGALQCSNCKDGKVAADFSGRQLRRVGKGFPGRCKCCTERREKERKDRAAVVLDRVETASSDFRGCSCGRECCHRCSDT